MALEKHTIELAAKDTLSPALKNIATNAENAGRKAEEAGKKGTASTQDWSRAASNMGKVLGGLGAIAIKLGNESEVAQTRLEASIANTGDAYDTLKDKIDDATDAALAFAFDDEDAINAISTLTDATGSAETAIRDLAVAQDIARGRGIDLAAATNIVVAAETGRIGSLKRMGIAIDANATAEEAVAALQAKYAGQAAAYATTNAAAWDRMGNTIENALEAVGGHLADFQGPLIALGGASQLIGPLGDAFEALGAKAKASQIGTAILGTGLVGPVGLATLALGAAAGITYLIEKMDRYEDAAKKAALATDDLDNFFRSLSVNLNPAIAATIITLSDNLNTIIDDAAQRQSDLDKLLTLQMGVTNAGIDIATQAAQDLATETTGLTVEQLKWIDTNHDLVVSVDEVNAAVGMFQGSLDRLDADQVGEVQTAIQALFSTPNADLVALTGDINRLNHQFDTGAISGEEYVGALQDMARNYGQYVNAATAAKVATDDVTQSIYGGTLALAGNKDAIEDGIKARQAMTDAIEAELLSMRVNSGEVQHNAEVHAALNAEMTTGPIEDYVAQLAVANTGFSSLAHGADMAGEAISKIADEDIAKLAKSLQDIGASGLDRYMGMIVGFTNGIVSSVGAAKDWADSLIGVRGVLSDVDKYFKEGSPEWENAQKAQESITADYNRTLEASQKIQILQAPLIAAQADAAADYIEKIAGMNAGEQLLALAWADQDMSGRAMQIADMAAEFGDMSDAQKQAFGSMVTSAAATDPALAAVLESLGLIKKSTTDPSGWEVTLGTSQAEDSIDKLATAMAILIATITGTPDVAVNADLDSEEFWKAYYALPSSKDLTLYINTVGGDGLAYHALGGTAKDSLDHAALGRVGRGMAMVGENGPELVTLPHGSVVTPNHATRYAKNGGSSDGGGMVIQNMTVVANSPQEFMRQMRQYEQGMNRR